MADAYLPDIVGQFQRGQAFGTQQRLQREGEQRQSRLSELSQLAYGAQTPEARQSALGDLAGVDAGAAISLGGQLGKQDESQREELVKSLALVASAPEEYKPAVYRNVVGALRQKFPGLPIPDEIDDNARKAIAAIQSAYGAQGGKLGDRYRNVGNNLIDLQTDPTKPIYSAPGTPIVGEAGVYQPTAEGLRELPILGQPGYGDQPEPQRSVQTPEGPVNIGSGVPANVAAAIQADPSSFTDGGVVQAGPQVVGGGFRPKGSADNAERLRLAQDANRLANEAAEARRRQEDIRNRFGTIPPGQRVNAAGDGLEDVPGARRPEPSDSAKTAATLLQRLEFSEQQLNDVLKASPSAATPEVDSTIAGNLPLVGGIAANALNSSARRQVEAAQLDILDAALTLGTGAAYTREQLEGYRQSYFPQIGDDKDTVDAKQARLKNVIDAAKIKAGRAAPQGGASGGQATPAQVPDARRRALLDKY